MTGYYKKTFNELENQINELLFEQENQLTAYEKVIEIILHKIAKLKEYVLKTGFKNKQEEIHFFKHIKPQFIAKLIYYNAVYKIESKKPNETKSAKKFFETELKKLKKFFDNNLEFYKYYRTNNTFIDDQLFVRGKYDIKLNLDTFYFETDHSFSTIGDYKAGKILANDLIQVYLEDQLNSRQYKKEYGTSPLNWTGNKTALVPIKILNRYAFLIFGF